MTGIYKSYHKLSFLLAAAVLCLGLIITGCSEGSNDSAAVNYDVTAAKLDVIVGMSKDAAAIKGLDVPAEAFNMVVSLIAGDKIAAEKSFVAPGSEWDGAAYWKEMSDSMVMMSSSFSEEYLATAGVALSDITAVAVKVYDSDCNLIGALCEDGVTLAKGEMKTVDFTAEDAPAFRDAAALAADTILALTTEPAVEDDVVIIVVHGTATVTAKKVMALSDETSVAEDVADDDLVLSVAEETTAVTVEGNVVTGVQKTDAPVEIVVAAGEGEDALTASVFVVVEGDEIASYLNVEVEPSVGVAGDSLALTVTDADGSSVAYDAADCTVEITDADGNDASAAFIQDADNGWQFTVADDAAAGIYTFNVGVADIGENKADFEVYVFDRGVATLWITLDPDLRDFNAGDTFTIKEVLQKSDESPITGYEVSYHVLGGSSTSGGLTEKNGVYTAVNNTDKLVRVAFEVTKGDDFGGIIVDIHPKS